MQDLIPNGDSCVGCPYRGSLTFYEEDGVVSVPVCHALAIADFSEVQPYVFIYGVPYEKDTEGNLSRDLKICNINK